MVTAAQTSPVTLSVENLSIQYNGKTVLSGVNFDIHQNEIFGIIGPAGSGKTSFLRILNRMDPTIPGMEYEGTVRFKGRDLREWKNLYALRRKVGVVFPLPPPTVSGVPTDPSA